MKRQCTAITEESLLAANREVLSSNEDLVQPKFKKKKERKKERKKSPRETSEVSGEAGHVR